MTPNIYPGWSLFHKNLLRPKQAKWLPHMRGLCSQNLRRGRLSLRSALPHSRACGWMGFSPGSQQTWGSQSLPFGLSWGKAVICLSISFLQGPSHLHALWPQVAQGLIWAGEENQLNSHSNVNTPNSLISVYLKFQQFSKRRTIFNGGILGLFGPHVGIML